MGGVSAMMLSATHVSTFCDSNGIGTPIAATVGNVLVSLVLVCEISEREADVGVGGRAGLRTSVGTSLRSTTLASKRAVHVHCPTIMI
jgi:hypothetical protein